MKKYIFNESGSMEITKNMSTLSLLDTCQFIVPENQKLRLLFSKN